MDELLERGLTTHDPLCGGTIEVGETEMNGAPVGVHGDYQVGVLPGSQIPYEEGEAGAGPVRIAGSAGAHAHYNTGLSRNEEGDMAVGADATFTSGHGEVDLGPLRFGVDGPSADAHASVSENKARMGAEANLYGESQSYDDGDHQVTVGGGVGVGGGVELDYDKDPRDGRRYFGASASGELGLGVDVGFKTKTPIEDAEGIPGKALDWEMGAVGLNDYSPHAVAKRADDWLQGLVA